VFEPRTAHRLATRFTRQDARAWAPCGHSCDHLLAATSVRSQHPYVSFDMLDVLYFDSGVVRDPHREQAQREQATLSCSLCNRR
jgi:hypothetical protein